MSLEKLYQKQKVLAFSVAYKMLRSIQEAEDIVQELYVQLEKVDLTTVSEPKVYMMKMVVNRCLNHLQSARHKREVYTVPWLPEPLIDIQNEPLNNLLRQESISYAFNVLLQTLTELERGVYILRESLVYDYATISIMLNRTEQSLRKVYSRANPKLKSANKDMKFGPTDSALATLFIEGTKDGDFEPFIEKLTDDVVLVTDGGGKVLAALRPIYSKKKVSAFLQGIYQRGSFQGDFKMIYTNGEIGILQEVNGIPSKAIMFDHRETGIMNIYFMMNPNKLSKIGHKLSL